jgi:hypothetical protein
MKTSMNRLDQTARGSLQGLLIVLACATLFLGARESYAGRGFYGVSSSSVGRGTEYNTSRGGSAYVGPNGAAARGAYGNSAAVTKNGTIATGQKNAYGGTTYHTSNGGSAYVGANGAVARGSNGTVVAGRLYAPCYPYGYITAIPMGYSVAYYEGYNCYLVDGVYYRPEFYNGVTVYVVVNG